MNEILDAFLDEEVTGATYNDLWNFINSTNIVRGTYEGMRHVVMKMSPQNFIIYREFFMNDNMKYQDAVIVGKNYLLKKINSKAYERKLPDINNILG